MSPNPWTSLPSNCKHFMMITTIYHCGRNQITFRIRHHNKLLQYFERNFLHQKGLHNRFWFRHIVYASGRYTGYAGQTLPGLNEAIEDGDFDRFVHWVNIFARTLKRINRHS